jgi:hypothetical protein
MTQQARKQISLQAGTVARLDALALKRESYDATVRRVLDERDRWQALELLQDMTGLSVEQTIAEREAAHGIETAPSIHAPTESQNIQSATSEASPA